MPGLSCLYLIDLEAAPSDQAWERAVASTACDAPSTVATRHRDPRLRLATSAHAAYPIAFHDSGHALVGLEGRVYGIETGAAVAQLAAAIPPADPGLDPAAALRQVT